MTRHITVILSLFFLSPLISSNSALAGELTILDQHGLQRVIEEISAPRIVRVELSDRSKELRFAKLISIDGFAPDVIADVSSVGQALFSPVSPGRWQLKLDPEVQIRSVELDD